MQSSFKMVLETHPISKNILRISSRTLSRGWRAPPFGGIPSASKLYFLKVDVFHAPLLKINWVSGEGQERTYDVIISTVRSVSCFAIEVLNFEPLCTVNHWPFLIMMSVKIPRKTVQT